MKRYRDPVYRYIVIPSALAPIAESHYMARLRGISQNGRALSTYPGLSGTRYEHALGTMHLSMLAWENAWRNVPDVRDYDSFEIRQKFVRSVFRYLRSVEIQFPDALAEDVQDGSLTLQDFTTSCPLSIQLSVGAVGLTHDIGHTPFSHTLEPEYSQHRDALMSHITREQLADLEASNNRLQFHEACGSIILHKLLSELPLSPPFSSHIAWAIYNSSAEAIGGKEEVGWAQALHEIVSGDIDADRIDYLVRDSYRSGTEFGGVDVDRLLYGVSLHYTPNEASGDWRVGYDVSAISAVESLLTNRENAYRWMYFHPNSLIADTALRRLFSELLDIAPSHFDNLDHVSYWKHGDAFYPRSYCVDDAAMMTAIRSCMESLRHHRDYPRLFALWRACDPLTSSYVAAWSDYPDLLRQLMRMDPDWKRSLLQIHGLKTSAERTRSSSEADLSSALTECVLARERTDPHLDLTLEAQLNHLYDSVQNVVGTWVVAVRTRSPTNGPEKIEMWHHGERKMLRRFSPGALGLKYVAQQSVSIWAFFLPHSDERVLNYQDEEVRGFVSRCLLSSLVRSEENESEPPTTWSRQDGLV